MAKQKNRKRKRKKKKKKKKKKLVRRAGRAKRGKQESFHFARGTLLENAQCRAESLSKKLVDDRG